MENQKQLNNAISSFLDRFHPETAKDIAVLQDIQACYAAGQNTEQLYSKFATIGDIALLTAFCNHIPNWEESGVGEVMRSNPNFPNSKTKPRRNPDSRHPLLTLNETIELDLQGLVDYEAMLPGGEIAESDKAGCEGRIQNLQSLFDRVPRTLHETDFTNNNDPLFPELLAAKQQIALNQKHFTRLCIAIKNRFAALEREHERTPNEGEMEEAQEQAPMHSETPSEPTQEEVDQPTSHIVDVAHIQAAILAAKKAAARDRQLRLRREAKAREELTHNEQVRKYEESARKALRLQETAFTEDQAQYLKRQAELRDEERLHELEREHAETRARQKEDLRQYEERMERSRNYESFGMEHIDLSGAGHHGNTESTPCSPRTASAPIPPHSEVEPTHTRHTQNAKLRNPEEVPFELHGSSPVAPFEDNPDQAIDTPLIRPQTPFKPTSVPQPEQTSLNQPILQPHTQHTRETIPNDSSYRAPSTPVDEPEYATPTTPDRSDTPRNFTSMGQDYIKKEDIPHSLPVLDIDGTSPREHNEHSEMHSNPQQVQMCSSTEQSISQPRTQRERDHTPYSAEQPEPECTRVVYSDSNRSDRSETPLHFMPESPDLLQQPETSALLRRQRNSASQLEKDLTTAEIHSNQPQTSGLAFQPEKAGMEPAHEQPALQPHMERTREVTPDHTSTPVAEHEHSRMEYSSPAQSEASLDETLEHPEHSHTPRSFSEQGYTAENTGAQPSLQPHTQQAPKHSKEVSYVPHEPASEPVPLPRYTTPTSPDRSIPSTEQRAESRIRQNDGFYKESTVVPNIVPKEKQEPIPSSIPEAPLHNSARTSSEPPRYAEQGRVERSAPDVRSPKGNLRANTNSTEKDEHRTTAQQDQPIIQSEPDRSSALHGEKTAPTPSARSEVVRKPKEMEQSTAADFVPHHYTAGGYVAPTYTHTYTHTEIPGSKPVQEPSSKILPDQAQTLRNNQKLAHQALMDATGTAREEEARQQFTTARSALQSASKQFKAQTLHYDDGSVPATDVRNVSKQSRTSRENSFTACRLTPVGLEGETITDGRVTGKVAIHNKPGSADKLVLSHGKPLLVTPEYEDTLYRSAQYAKTQLPSSEDSLNSTPMSAAELAGYKMCLDAYTSFSYAKKEGYVRVTDSEYALSTPNQRAWAARQETYRRTHQLEDAVENDHAEPSEHKKITPRVKRPDQRQDNNSGAETPHERNHRQKHDEGRNKGEDNNRRNRRDEEEWREQNEDEDPRNHKDDNDRRNRKEDDNHRNRKEDEEHRNNDDSNDRRNRNNDEHTPDEEDSGGRGRSRRCPKCGQYLIGPVCFNCLKREERDPEPIPQDHSNSDHHFKIRPVAPFGSIFSVRYHRGRYTSGEKESSADLFGRSTKLKQSGILRNMASSSFDRFRLYAPEAAFYAAQKFYAMAQSENDTSSQSIRTFEQMRYYGTAGVGLALAATQRNIGDVNRFRKASARSERKVFGFTRNLSDKEIARKRHALINKGRSEKKEIRELYEIEASLDSKGKKQLAQKIKDHKATGKEATRMAALQQARTKERLQTEILEDLHRNPKGPGLVTEQSIKNLENHRKQVQQQRNAIRKTQTERSELNKRISELQKKGGGDLTEAEQQELSTLRMKLGKLDSDPRLKALDKEEQELLRKIKGPHDDTTVPLKNVRLKDVDEKRKKILSEYNKLENRKFREFRGVKNSAIKKNKALLERQSERAKHQLNLLSKKAHLTADEKQQLKTLNKILKENQSRIKAHADVLKARGIRDSKLEILDKVRKQIQKRKQRIRIGKMALINFMMKPLQEGDQIGAQGLAKGISYGMNPYLHALIKKTWHIAYRTTAFVVKKVAAKTGLDKAAAPVINKARAVKQSARKFFIETPKEQEKLMRLRSKQRMQRIKDRLTPKFIKTGKSYVHRKAASTISKLQKTKLGKAYEAVTRTISKIKALIGTISKTVMAFLGKFMLFFLLFILIIALISILITSVGTAVPSTIIMGTETTEDGKIDLSPYAEIYNEKLEAFKEDIVAAKTHRHYDNITEICYGATDYNNIKEVLSMMAVRMSQDLDLNTKPQIKRYIRSLFDDSHILESVESDPYSCEGCMYRFVVLPHDDECEEDCSEVHIGTELYCPGNHVDLTLKVTTLSFDEIFTADSMGNAGQEVQAGGLIGDDFQITFYLPTGNKTASGTVPKAGRTIAVDPSVIPLGTHVIINGHEYVAEDTGGAINGHIIDIFVDDEDDIPAAGRLHNVSVYLADYVGEGVQSSEEWNGWVEENRLFAKNLYNAPWDDLYDGIDAIGTYVGNMVDYDWDSFEYSAEGNLTQAQQRVAYIAKNSNLFGIPAQAGYCQQWVRLVYSEAGYSGGSAASANDAAEQWLVSNDWSGIPVGAAVYGYSSSIYGHVGIYVGDCKVYHNIGGVAIDDLQSWVTKYKGYGWGWQGGHDLTQSN